MRRMGLAARITLLLAVSLAAVLGVFSATGVISVRNSQDRVLQERVALARALAGHIDYVLDENLRTLQQLALQADLRPGQVNDTAAQRLLHDAYLNSIFSGGILLLNSKGGILVSDPQTSLAGSQALVSQDYVQQALTNGRPIVSGVYDSPASGRPVVSAAVPVWDGVGAVGGLLVGDVDVSNGMPEGVLQQAGISQSGSAQLIDSAGMVFASTDPAQIMTASDHAGHVQKLISAGKALVGTCHDCHEPSATQPTGKDLMAFAPLQAAPWAVAIREPESEALAPVHNLEKWFIWLGVGVLLGGLLLAWTLAQSIARPLGQLTKAANRITEGDLSTTVPRFGRDEVGRLAQAFETMRGRLRESLEQIQGWGHQLEGQVQKRTAELRQSNERLQRSMTERARLYEELERRDAARAELLRKVITAQEDERRRIARELHDETSQGLTTLVIGLDDAATSTRTGRNHLPERLQDMKSMAVTVLENVHKIIYDLRPSLLDDLGLVAAARWYAESRLQPQGIETEVTITGRERRLPPELETVLYRITQEAVNNIARHSGATHARLRMRFARRGIDLQVRDDGQGFDLPALEAKPGEMRGLGLMGMQERVALLDGQLKVQSAPGKGTEIDVYIPVPEVQDDGKDKRPDR